LAALAVLAVGITATTQPARADGRSSRSAGNYQRADNRGSDDNRYQQRDNRDYDDNRYQQRDNRDYIVNRYQRSDDRYYGDNRYRAYDQRDCEPRDGGGIALFGIRIRL